MIRWNYQLSDDEIERIVAKMYELDRTPSIDPEKDRALRAWSIMATKDMLTAMHALGYAIVKTTTGVFREVKAQP